MFQEPIPCTGSYLQLPEWRGIGAIYQFYQNDKMACLRDPRPSVTLPCRVTISLFTTIEGRTTFLCVAGSCETVAVQLESNLLTSYVVVAEIAVFLCRQFKAFVVSVHVHDVVDKAFTIEVQRCHWRLVSCMINCLSI